ncbi:MAG: glycosyltransferase family 4 protein [Gammaproteobacteria bacterium]|nr:glycosyltransferase family 4 protein [Gammaproteobacteria bacterium]
MRRLYRRACSRGTRFVVQSEAFRQRLLALLGPDTDVGVVWNNCNRDSIDDPQHVLSTRPRRLLLVSRIDTEGKGIDLAIAALAQLDPEYTLTIVGDGEDLAVLRSEHGTNERLSFLGRVENASRLMSVYDMLVAPSRLDAYPNVVLEGLWHRIPIVASDIEGHRSILGEDYPLAPLTAAGLAQSIRRRAEDDAFNREILRLQELRREHHIFDWVDECARELFLP